MENKDVLPHSTRVVAGGIEHRINQVAPKPLPEFISERPVGFEELRDASVRAILKYAGKPLDDPAALKELTPKQLYELANGENYFRAGGSVDSTIPGGADKIRRALTLRASLLIESAKTSGSNPGEDIEDHLRQIREALYDLDNEPDDGFMV